MKHNKHTVIAVMTLVVCLGLAGCGMDHSDNAGQKTDNGQDTSQSGSQAGGGNELLDTEGIQKEYKDTIKKLEYPEGYTPPEQMENLQATSFQSGYGNSVASWDWVCSWEQDWLNAYSSNNNEASKALNQLGEAKNMPFLGASQADDATRRMFQDRLDKAGMGDPSGMQQDVEANCSSR
jgi:hypothetical protein